MALILGHIILILFLVSGWAAAWLHWCFDGEIRHMLFAYVFPASWRAGMSPAYVMTLSKEEFELFLAADSSAPSFVRGVLGCPGCLCAHIAAAGVLLGAASFLSYLFLLPLLWASAAWAGHLLHRRF
jgi:hypothetical protein